MTVADDLNRMFAEAHERFERDSLPKILNGPPPTITVTKSTGYLMLSVDQLLDAGAITESEARAQGWTPPPPPTHRDRLRWHFQAWRERAGRKIGGWLAGVDLSERDEDW